MSIRIAFIRHGPTDWNAVKRLQGHSDRPLSQTGEDTVRTWRLPQEISAYQPHTSPLLRARQTAEILLGEAPPIAKNLIEMSFGDWEGERLPDLRATLGAAMVENEARGLDFTPPNGESPRMVQSRIMDLLQGWSDQGADRLAFTHKGVIRSVYAKSVNWDMTGRPPDKLDWSSAHVFKYDTVEGLTPLHLNLALTPPGTHR